MAAQKNRLWIVTPFIDKVLDNTEMLLNFEKAVKDIPFI
jgi:hypothetical protein